MGQLGGVADHLVVLLRRGEAHVAEADFHEEIVQRASVAPPKNPSVEPMQHGRALEEVVPRGVRSPNARVPAMGWPPTKRHGRFLRQRKQRVADDALHARSSRSPTRLGEKRSRPALHVLHAGVRDRARLAPRRSRSANRRSGSSPFSVPSAMAAETDLRGAIAAENSHGWNGRGCCGPASRRSVPARQRRFFIPSAPHSAWSSGRTWRARPWPDRRTAPA